MQRRVARRHRAHQHVGAARGVLGQRLDRDVGAERLALAAEREGVEGEPGAPGVVERDDHVRALARQRAAARQVGELHRHRARRLEPDQAGRRRQRGAQRRRHPSGRRSDG